MSISRQELAKMLVGVENSEDIINYVMAENGKQINALRAENEDLKTKLSDSSKLFADKESEFATFKDGVKDFETIKKENEDLKNQIKSYVKKENDGKYLSELAKAGVDSKYQEFVYSKVVPNENESLEDYNKRAVDYLNENTQFKSETYQAFNSQVNIEGSKVDFTKMSDEDYLNYKASLRK